MHAESFPRSDDTAYGAHLHGPIFAWVPSDQQQLHDRENCQGRHGVAREGHREAGNAETVLYEDSFT